MTEGPLDRTRQAFAETLRERCGLASGRLLGAFAAVPRERFLGPGPWLVRGPADAAGPRRTGSADPACVYEDASIAIDAERDLYNGQPGVVAPWIESLGIRAGDDVLHIGCGTGYYTAVLAEVTGPGGRVTAIEVDPDLAARAAAALEPWPQTVVVAGDGRTGLPSSVDAVLVHAGATHVLTEWLDAAADGGRMLVPLACAFPGLPATLGKGLVLSLRREGARWHASAGSVVMIYTLAAWRDEAMNRTLGRAMLAGTAGQVRALRRDPHDEDERCWLHAPGACLTAQEA